jgi:parallel beta-helix repeat protein
MWISKRWIIMAKKIGSMVLFAIIFSSLLAGLISITPKSVSQHTFHDVIYIQGDEDFAQHAADENWTGDGSEENPYIIENYEINRTSEIGIEIISTTVHFIIRDSIINGRDSMIQLNMVRNGIIENCVLDNNDDCIILENSNNIQIKRNVIHSNWDFGITLSNSHNIIITDNNFTDCSRGISLYKSTGNEISSNNFTECYRSIRISSSGDNRITWNNISGNDYGISLDNSNNNFIENNTVNLNYNYGIYLKHSNETTIAYNNLENNSRGIGIDYSINNKVYNNSMVGCGVLLYGYEPTHWTDNNISTSNTVNSKPIYHLKNQNGGVVPQGVGQIILANCTNILVENHTISNIDIGIQIGHSTRNNINNNTISSANRAGIYIFTSDNNRITHNDLFENRIGNSISYCHNNTVANNDLRYNEYGIYLYSSDLNDINNNTLMDNERGGIYITTYSYSFSKNNSFIDNEFINDGFEISFYDDVNFQSNVIDTSNTVGGKPVYFMVNRTGETVPPGAGQIILINCADIVIEGQEIENTTTGIIAFNSSNIQIINNKIANTRCGIIFPYNYLSSETSYHVIISGNEIHSSYYGMELESISYSIIDNNKVTQCEWRGISLMGYEGGNNITNNNLSQNYNGLYLYDTGANVSGNVVTGNDRIGIDIRNSRNLISNNIVSLNGKGISIDWDNSHNTTIIDNAITNNEIGIHSDDSLDCRIVNNDISNNLRHGIEIYRSHNISIENNSLLHNTENGIHINESTNNFLYNNTLEHNGVFISGRINDSWDTHEINSSNTVNGKPLYFWKDRDGGTVPNDAGQIILASCRNIIIQDQIIMNTTVAIAVGHSSFCFISNNEIRNNIYGICLASSGGIRITENEISENHFGTYLDRTDQWPTENRIVSNEISENTFGLYFRFGDDAIIIANDIMNNDWGIFGNRSDENMFHHNNIFDNNVQLIFTGEDNEWDNEFGEGNFWGNYEGTDSDGDGIGDTHLPHLEVDEFPLMEPAVITLNYEHPEPEEDPNGDEELTIPRFPVWVGGLFGVILITAVILATISIRRKKKKETAFKGQQNEDLFGSQVPASKEDISGKILDPVEPEGPDQRTEFVEDDPEKDDLHGKQF